MSRQLHGTSRRLQSDPEAHKQQCIAQVISGNLVSPLRFIAPRDLNHGFVTRNRIDAADVVERFLSFEKRVPSPGALVGDIIKKLEDNDDNLLYHFPRELTSNRELVMTCPFVRIKRCADLYHVYFGHGFDAPKFCSQVPYDPIPLRRLDFALLHIPNSHGTKAFSGEAAAQAICQHLKNTTASTSERSTSQLVLQHRDLQCKVAIETLFCPATTGDTVQTPQGLLVIPVSSIPSSGQLLERVFLFCSLEPKTITRSGPERYLREEILGEASSMVHASVEHLFGERSASRLHSVTDFLRS